MSIHSVVQEVVAVAYVHQLVRHHSFVQSAREAASQGGLVVTGG
jgi:hypothetical protein